MRNRDERKEEAIINASIKIINEIGFSSISMSKIAKLAEVSPATIYIYFENKDDLLRKCYLMIKKKMSASMFDGINFKEPIKDVMNNLLIKFIAFCINNKDYFMFIEQFANAPILNDVCKKEGMEYFKPMHNLISKGKEKKIFKQYELDILLAFIFAPTMHILKGYIENNSRVTKEVMNNISQIIWDGLKI